MITRNLLSQAAKSGTSILYAQNRSSIPASFSRAIHFDILLSLKEEDSYCPNLGYRLVTSEGTFDLSLRIFRYDAHVESIAIEELALQKRDILAHRHES
ncbi:MAG: hypothetical protein V4489_09005 [Chlamydiota bacterium]